MHPVTIRAFVAHHCCIILSGLADGRLDLSIMPRDRRDICPRLCGRPCGWHRSWDQNKADFFFRRRYYGIRMAGEWRVV